MTKSIISAAIVCTILITGCGGGGSEATPEPATATSAPAEATSTPEATKTAQGAPELPKSAASEAEANAACERWQDAGGKGSHYIAVGSNAYAVTCVGAE